MQRWTLLVPVKPLDRAKTRLEPPAGADRSELALAFALDTVEAARSCPAVARVVVVTPDERVRAALAGLDVSVAASAPEGLNPALRAAADGLRGDGAGGPLAAVTADLPALVPDQLDRVLQAASRVPLSFLADADGIGTTVYCARDRQRFAPAYGPGSRARHLHAGAVELGLADVASVRRDVDTVADLASARALGLGPCTSALLTRAA
ncbi:2-phospho-L-lactate guanylyltransferase [Motilibacter deserti]|uniref:2-phospho-L-lactate guanylyltransferase n=1 Tax=Motilibacter deserti TaxID=2714956 RepID=UPI002F2B7E34